MELKSIQGQANAFAAEQLELLRRTTNIDSCTGDLAGNKRMVELLMPELMALGAKAELRSGRNGSCILARFSPGAPGKKILMSAHMDTVFAQGEAAAHPFHVEGDFAYGLGSSDNKGGVVTLLYSLKVLHALGRLPKREIVVIYNCDEETGSQTGKDTFREVCSDGGVGRALVFEPTRGNGGLITERGGVGYLTLETWGNEVHSGIRFSDGRNAVIEASDQIIALSALTDMTQNILVNIGSIEGGTAFSDAPCMVPGYCKVRLSIRAKSPSAAKELMQRIDKLVETPHIDGCTSKITGEFIYYPMDHQLNYPLYLTARALGEQMGMKLGEISSFAGGDANHVNQYGIPTLDGLGPYMYGIHTLDEHIAISSMTERTAFAAALLSYLDTEST